MKTKENFSGISVKSLSKSFDGKTVLDDLSLDFSSHGVYAIMGPSGCGKTTLLRIICGLEQKDAGEVNGGGLGLCSFAFQEHRLFPSADAIENVICVTVGDRQERERKAKALLGELALSEEEVKKPTSQLSGGMRQRVSLARAFAADMPTVLLDEPDKELDAYLRESLAALIRREGESRLIIAITHSEDFARAITDKIIRMK